MEGAQLNIYAYLSFNAFVVSAFVAHIVLRNSSDQKSRMFAILSLTIAAFAFIEFQLRIAGDYEMAEFWLKAYTLWPFAVALLLNFALVYTESTEFLKSRLSYVLIYGPAFILSSFGLFMDEFMGRPDKYYWGWTYESMGDPIIGAVIPIWAVLMSFLALYLCLSYYLKQEDAEKKGQAKFVTVGLVVPILFGSFSSIGQMLAGSRYPEMQITSFTFGNFFIAYGISKYGLFNINPATAAGNITRNMSDSLFLVDSTGTIVKVNKAASRLTGMTERYLIGMPMTKIFTGSDGKALGERWYKQVVGKDAKKYLDASIMRPGGRSIPVSFTTSVIRDASGNVQGLVMLGRDVTERRKTQEKERKYFHDMALLSQMTVEYADLPMEYDIFEFIGDKVLEQIGKGYIFMLFYDDRKDAMVIRSVHGIDDKARKALKLIGKDIVGMEFPLTDEARFKGDRPHLKKLEGDLAALTSGVLPASVINTGGRMMGIRSIYEMGIINEGKQFGSVIIIPKRKNELEDLELIEALINQASVAIQRRQAQIAIKDMEDRYRSLFDGSMDAVYTSDFEGHFIDANQAAQDLTGYRKEEIGGVNFATLLEEEDLEKAFGTVEELMKVGYQRDPVEFRLKRKDGSRVWVEVMSSLVLKGGVPVAIQGIARDISARRKVEEAIRESEEKYRTLVERSHDGVYIEAIGGLVFINERVCDITEYNTKELMEMSMLDLIHPEDREVIEEVTKARREGKGAPHTYEARIMTRRKNVRYCEFSVSNIMFDGDYAELGAVRDITLRRQVEHDVQDYAKALERSNKELEQFAYVASHDLQEPLRMVASYVQLLERRYKGKLDDDADEFIEYAVDGAKRMQTLINDLLQYSRVNTRGKPFEPLELQKIFDIATANLKIAIEESGAEITHDDLPPISGDPSQLAQLMQNLMANAIKFRGDSSPKIHVGVEQEERMWKISVKDNGIGIDPEYKERIFVIFQRLHGREEYEGTGIGLAVCKRIVERHGGEIWVESEPGEGATFNFTFPINRSETP